MRFLPGPATFRVEELPLFAPTGEGEHLLLTVQKSGIDTATARRRLAEYLEVPVRDIGYAGLKDAASTSVQGFSVPARKMTPDEARKSAPAQKDPACFILVAARHSQRLRIGQLAGNRFRAVLRGSNRHGPEIAAGLRRLARDGFANRFGPQRWGRDGANSLRGRQVLAGKRRGSRDRLRLWLSAYQAEIFNRILERRIRESLLDAQEGDILVPAGRRSESLRGLVKAAPNPAVAARRGLLVPSGPIPGYRTPWADADPGALEREEAAAAGWPESLPRRVAGVTLDGSRRALKVHPRKIGCIPGPHSVVVEFNLPPGSYASVLIAELLALIPPADNRPRL